MNKKVFISYSWTNPEHEDWVLSLAQRLVHDAVDVKLDKWDLKEGQDKYTFMESMVTAADIDKVLIICDKKYAERSDARTGGVGAETLIITPKVYESTEQKKFVPLVTQTDENGKAYLPTYIGSRIYIDFSKEDDFEGSYEQLLRSIFERPLLSKPALGAKPPSYLFEDTPMSFKTTTMVRGLEAQLNKYPHRLNSLSRDFLQVFQEDLSTFIITQPANNPKDLGKQIFDILHQYLPLRNDYIQFLDILIKSGLEFDGDVIFRFLERLSLLLAPQNEQVLNWNHRSYEHFKFIIHELFLYTVGIALKNENYNFLENIFQGRYFMQGRDRSRPEPESYASFYHYYDSMDVYYKDLHGQNITSVHADILIKFVPEYLGKDVLVNADLLSYHVGQVYGDDWFPITYIYRNPYNHSFDFFSRLLSKRHFEKVKGVLGVENIGQLKMVLTELQDKQKERGYSNARGWMPVIADYIKVDAVGESK
ncbi:SEFIR domain-containing protein [Mucilaginibacter sp. OK268]|uniref:SEFIR domain-containing protein n=1 Tax=Mucilaginibacter sp. OK268 TaxID=1881048 RepID=UPI0008901380|nr:SEFIR domain-containing protein [Mucilaginibacter sp. OK268]SDP13058.1 SEFIR domain-containing protein [Mucilaginibacter sp. OK268]